MKTVRIMKIGVLSLGAIMGAFYCLIGLIIGFVAAIISLFSSGSGSMGIIGGLASIILLPLFYGIVGLVAGFISAFIFNVVAPRLGGLEVGTE